MFAAVGVVASRHEVTHLGWVTFVLPERLLFWETNTVVQFFVPRNIAFLGTEVTHLGWVTFSLPGTLLFWEQKSPIQDGSLCRGFRTGRFRELGWVTFGGSHCIHKIGHFTSEFPGARLPVLGSPCICTRGAYWCGRHVRFILPRWAQPTLAVTLGFGPVYFQSRKQARLAVSFSERGLSPAGFPLNACWCTNV